MGRPLSSIEKPVKKILFIDDNDVDLSIAKKLISVSKLNTKLTTQTSVEGALKHLSELKPDEKPDIIFLDLYLSPGVDGWYFLSVVELKPSLLSKHCQINILSSSLNTHDIIKTKKLSMVTNYFIKPFTFEIINEVIGGDL